MPSGSKNAPAEQPAVDGAVQPVKPFQRMLAEMAGIATMEETAPSDFDNADADRILNAESEDEMWDADDLPKYNAKSISGCDIQIYGIDVKFSRDAQEGDDEIVTRLIDPKSGRKMYLLVYAARISKAQANKEYNLPPVGEMFAWNTSARAIVPKLWWMLKHGWFDEGHGPVRVHVLGTPLGAGKSVEKLKPLSGPAAMNVATEDTEPPF